MNKIITASEKIKIILKRNNMTVGDLAERLGISRQNLSNKMSRDNFAERDLLAIAEALNCELSIDFISRKTGERL